ncbi:Tubulin polyglutamylase ttll4 [Gaertneriomyces sp. JEL0708]|nr:Tubulin polyglutamylase ttll4 [Gaertneriomyces sp. JEL0708]
MSTICTAESNQSTSTPAFCPSQGRRSGWDLDDATGATASDSEDDITSDLETLNDLDEVLGEEEDIDPTSCSLKPRPPGCSKEELCPPTRPSLFCDRTQWLYFPKVGEKVAPLPRTLQQVMKWKTSKWMPKVVRAVLVQSNFSLTRSRNWIASWGRHISPEKLKTLKYWQKVNHFPLCFEIGRKDKLWVNYAKLRSKFGHKEFDYMPETYLLPTQKHQLLSSLSARQPTHRYFILKPPASARGLGIRLLTHQALFRTVKKLKHRPVVISQYVQDPYLIGGRKFDIRLYVVVTSWEPLRVYFWQDGIARFAADQYHLTDRTRKNRHMHLTNYSVNKRRHRHPKSQQFNLEYLLGDKRFPANANKWKLKVLEAYFSKTGVEFTPVLERIHDLIVKTLISCQTKNAGGMRLYASSPSSCYELFGFDVLIDSQLKPWLMEVNISPSLKSSDEQDWELKYDLVTDVLNLVGFNMDTLEAAASGDGEGPKRGWTTSRGAKEVPIPIEGNRRTWANTLRGLDRSFLECLKEIEDENARRSGFVRLFPSPRSHEYLKYFQLPSYLTRLACSFARDVPVDATRIKDLQHVTHTAPADAKNVRSLPAAMRSMPSLPSLIAIAATRGKFQSMREDTKVEPSAMMRAVLNSRKLPLTADSISSRSSSGSTTRSTSFSHYRLMTPSVRNTAACSSSLSTLSTAAAKPSALCAEQRAFNRRTPAAPAKAAQVRLRTASIGLAQVDPHELRIFPAWSSRAK